jgi:hypothetical protein
MFLKKYNSNIIRDIMYFLLLTSPLSINSVKSSVEIRMLKLEQVNIPYGFQNNLNSHTYIMSVIMIGH